MSLPASAGWTQSGWTESSLPMQFVSFVEFEHGVQIDYNMLHMYYLNLNVVQIDLLYLRISIFL